MKLGIGLHAKACMTFLMHIDPKDRLTHLIIVRHQSVAEEAACGQDEIGGSKLYLSLIGGIDALYVMICHHGTFYGIACKQGASQATETLAKLALRAQSWH